MALEYRGNGSIKLATDIEVRSCKLVVGHVHKEIGSTGDEEWWWQLIFTGPGVRHRGYARSFEEAKVLLETNWRLWLSLAGLREV